MGHKVKYYDFAVGSLLFQAPSAWQWYRWKIAATSAESAIGTFKALGGPSSDVCRVEVFTVRACNGSTVVQYKKVDFSDVLNFETAKPGPVKAR